MKLATLRDGTRDGALIVVDSSGTRFVPASAVAKTMQDALDRSTAYDRYVRQSVAKREGGR